MKLKSLAPFLVFPALTLLAGTSAGLLSGGSRAAYEALQKPPLSPPGWIFPVVWALLYLLMGLGLALVWRSNPKASGPAVRIYLLQLLVNLLWTFFFFRWELRGFAFFWLLLLIFLTVVMILRFDRLSTPAAWMQIPYLLWLIFAAYLNFAVWQLNR